MTACIISISCKGITRAKLYTKINIQCSQDVNIAKNYVFPLLLESNRYNATARQYKCRVSSYFYHVPVCKLVSQQNQIRKLLRGMHTLQYIKMNTVTYVNFSASLNFFIFCLRITLPYTGSFSSNFTSFISSPSNLGLAGGGSILST